MWGFGHWLSSLIFLADISAFVVIEQYLCSIVDKIDLDKMSVSDF